MKHLNSEILQRLDKIMEQLFTVLVGDANGIDKAVQKHYAAKNYGNVIVFCAGNSCRNNIGGWETKFIGIERSTKDYKFYMAKDIVMAKEADYGFMIWDYKSSGTLSNILEMIERGKKVLVYIGPNKMFITLRSIDDLRRVIEVCPEKEINIFDSKFCLLRRLEAETPNQVPMFS